MSKEDFDRFFVEAFWAQRTSLDGLVSMEWLRTGNVPEDYKERLAKLNYDWGVLPLLRIAFLIGVLYERSKK